MAITVHFNSLMAAAKMRSSLTENSSFATPLESYLCSHEDIHSQSSVLEGLFYVYIQ